MGGYGLWQIEHRGEFRLALRRATSLPRGNKRDNVSYKTLVRWRFACALRGSARGFWFIDPLGLRPHGLCTVGTCACHVNHAPPSYNYNILYSTTKQQISYRKYILRPSNSVLRKNTTVLTFQPPSFFPADQRNQ